MVRLIKETPILFGEDARKFEERMKNPHQESPQDRNRRETNYKVLLACL